MRIFILILLLLSFASGSYNIGSLGSDPDLVMHASFDGDLNGTGIIHKAIYSSAEESFNVTGAGDFENVKNYTINQFITEISAETKINQTAPSAGLYKFEFDYVNGSSVNVSLTSAVQDVYLNETLLNPFPAENVSQVKLWLDSFGDLELFIRNVEFISDNPLFYLSSSEGTEVYGTGVDGSLNSSIELIADNAIPHNFLTTPNLPFGTNYTISMWVNIDNLNVIWGNSLYEGDTDDFSAGLQPSGLVAVSHDLVGSIVSPYAISANTWHNLVFLKSNRSMSIYIDNNLSISGVVGNDTYVDEMIIGGLDAFDGINGSVDELMLFNRSLSTSEISVLYGAFNGSVNITVYDYETGNLLTQDADLAVIDQYEVVIENGNILLNNGTFEDGEVNIYVSSTGYITNQKTFIYNASESTLIEIYLKKDNITNLGNLFAYTLNTNFYGITGADTRLLKYFASQAEFIEVEQCFSNSNGECVFNIILSEESYIITTTATQNNITAIAISSETGDFYPIDNTEIELFLNFEEQFTLPDDFDLDVLAFNTTLVGNTSFLTAIFSNPSGLSTTMCVGYFFNINFGEELGTESCTTASAGTVDVTSGYVLNRSFTWYGKIYSKNSDNETVQIYYSFPYPLENNFGDTFSVYVIPFLIALLAVILGVAILSRNILVFPIGTIILSIFAGILRPLIFTPTVIVVIGFLCVMIIYLGRKKSGNEVI